VSSIVLGINSFHGDASACVFVDGALAAAAEEERFRRVKHWAGFPSESIKWCLKEIGAPLGAVGHIGINQDSKASLGRKLGYMLTHRPNLGLVMDRLRNKRRRSGIRELIDAEVGEGFDGQLHFVEHHHAHLASAFLVSPFDDAVAVSVDGFGDFASAAWGYGAGTNVSLDGRVLFPHSLGIFYEALTQYLGFPHYGDEYKVMGLAPYGSPSFLDKMREVVRLRPDGSFALDLQYFRHATERVEYEWESGSPSVGKLFTPRLETLLGPARKADEPMTDRHRDIARSIQAMYEEAFFNLLNALAKRYGSRNLAIAGGCAMNSVANGKIYERSPFKRLYVQSAPGDAGGAIGAALLASARAAGPAATRFAMKHAYWGPEYDDAYVSRIVQEAMATPAGEGCKAEKLAALDVCSRTAEAIAAGNVVGWFQGRMEWGPRALGNRSIVCDPRLPNMKEILNAKIKRRESFRPFAPSILREAVADWFEVDDDVPFMTQVYPIRPERRAQIPAVTHVDGTGRLQTVTRGENPRYYELIEAFRERTGVPMVLNTSFNENEPVVCRPEEAMDCFLRTRMDVLVVGDWMVRRQPA
jgi:carbamoyltransferase